MNSASGGPHGRNRYTQAWIDSSSSYPESSDEQLAYERDEEGLAARLYRQCRNALRDLCSQEQSGRGNMEQSYLLKEELAMLYLWGQNLGPGELDAALEYSDDVLYAVLDALGNIGHALLKESSHHSSSGLKSSPTDQQARELKYLVEQARAIISDQGDDNEEDLSDSSSNTDGESISDDDEESGDIVSDMKSQIRHLMDLGPTVQQSHLYAQRTRVGDSFPPIVPFHLSDPAKAYASLVREKYKYAQDQLVDRLGERNWQRHRAIRENIENMNSHNKEEATLQEEVDPAAQGVESPYSVFRPYSAFHDSGLGTSVPAQTHYAQSHNSFQSSNSESSQGSIRVPPTPAEVGTGKAFQCPICSSTLANMRNRIEWKMHVFADLQPYICTFANCDKELAQFPTRAAWAEHEFKEHRIIRSWNCSECSKQCDSEVEWGRHLAQSHGRVFLGSQYHIAKHMAYTIRAKPIENEECPLCQVVLGKSRREFVKHVGEHMEKIALIVLPRENDEDSEASSTGQVARLSPCSDGSRDGSDSPAPTVNLPGRETQADKDVYSNTNPTVSSAGNVALVEEPSTTSIDVVGTEKSRLEKPEKCPITTCEYFHTGFASKHDKVRHILTHSKGIMVCRFCPGFGSALENCFRRKDNFKRHLRSVHGAELEKASTQAVDATGKCPTCSGTFRNAQEFYEHLDNCVIRAVEREEPCEATNKRRIEEAANYFAVRKPMDPQVISDKTWNPSAYNDGNGGAAISNEPSKPVIKIPIPIDHTTDRLNVDHDEYILKEFDEAGERKVSPLGVPLGGRQFKIRTFYLAHRGEKRFMLATESARALGYRDSYLLFNKNRSLLRIIATQQEKDELISIEVLPYAYRARQIAFVTAKSMFRQFGARVIEGGRRVRDDYWEAKAIKQGFTEADLAGDKRPGATKARNAAAAAEASQAPLIPGGYGHQQDIMYTNTTIGPKPSVSSEEILRTPLSSQDRWAQIRAHAAERAEHAQTGEGEDSDGESENIKSSVALIKARVAKLTGNTQSEL